MYKCICSFLSFLSFLFCLLKAMWLLTRMLINTAGTCSLISKPQQACLLNTHKGPQLTWLRFSLPSLSATFQSLPRSCEPVPSCKAFFVFVIFSFVALSPLSSCRVLLARDAACFARPPGPSWLLFLVVFF